MTRNQLMILRRMIRMQSNATLEAFSHNGDLILVFSHGLIARPANVMFWVNGCLIVTKFDIYASPPYWGHDWQETDTQIQVTIRKEIFKPEPGDVRCLASAWPQETSGPDEAVYAEEVIPIAGQPSPFLMPTEWSGRPRLPDKKVSRSLFTTDPLELERNGYAEAYKAAGVTHLEFGVFLNPANAPQFDSLKKLRQYLEANVMLRVEACERLGFELIAIGDDFCRQPEQRQWLYTCPWAPDAIHLLSSYLHYSKICRSIAVVDESNFLPAEETDDLEEFFVKPWREAGDVPITWPGQGPFNWETPALSDYSSRYWSAGVTAWRMCYPASVPSAWQIYEAMRSAAATALTNRPLGMQVSAMGPFYRKNGPGADYVPLRDTLLNGSTPPHLIIFQGWVALGEGNVSEIRTYSHDRDAWIAQRRDTPPSDPQEHGLQTGTKPWDLNHQAFAALCRSIAKREAKLATNHHIPTYSGVYAHYRWDGLIVTVNTSEVAVPSTNGPGTVIGIYGEIKNQTIIPAGGVMVYESDQ